MNNMAVNINELNKWQILLSYIKELYKNLIESEKNNNEDNIKYYKKAILDAKLKEETLIKNLNISEHNYEQIFSYISKITDSHMSLRMYSIYEPILLEIENYKGELNILKIIEFQKKKNDHIKKLEIVNYLALNNVFILKNSSNYFNSKLIIDQIYEIAYTHPNIEELILNDNINFIHIDKEDPYYKEIRKHIKNNIISIILEMKTNPNLIEIQKMNNYIEFVKYLTILNDYDLINEIGNKISTEYSNDILEDALNKVKELLNIKEKTKKAN